MGYSKSATNKAMDHGHQTESTARQYYLKLTVQNHNKLEVTQSGLHTDKLNPYLAATPDGIVSCECHGMGLLEIKCPYKHMKSLENWRSDPKCPVDKDGNIKQNHPYFFQIQHQMMVTQTNYFDFFVCLGDIKKCYEEEVYCYCKRPSFPPMIGCDGEKCPNK